MTVALLSWTAPNYARGDSETCQEPNSAQTAAAIDTSSMESDLTPLSKQTKGSSLNLETGDICKTHATLLDSDEKQSVA
ncbi:hypothetical protein BDR06DRAFT_726390 [Suillus hirtellus]|nr:hypothetical protein BDR06DRAFT_726390 [Suillus hirtellus]